MAILKVSCSRAYIRISKITVAEEIHHVVPILFVNFRHYIKWHSMQRWRQFLNQALPRIGNGRARNLPRRARLLADEGYAARVPLIVPRWIARNRRQRQANRALRSLRIQIEHSIGFHKVYTSVNSIFRHSGIFYHLLFVRVAFYQTGES